MNGDKTKKAKTYTSELNSGRPVRRTKIGGQALIEGLLMMGPERVAMCCRRADGRIETEALPLPKTDDIWARLPVVRGSVRLFRQLKMGMKAIFKSAEYFEADQTDQVKEAEKNTEDVDSAVSEAVEVKTPETEVEPADVETNEVEAAEIETAGLVKESTEKSAKSSTMSSLQLGLTVALSMTIAVGLFILLPNLVAGLILGPRSAQQAWGMSFFYNLFEGLIRIVILLSYLGLTSLLPDLRRIWMYHGAEHKAIACYEHGDEMTAEAAATYSRFHPRCGTSFLIQLIIISVLVFAVVGWYGIWLNLLIRLLLLPLIAGLSYELLLWVGKHSTTLPARIFAAPGLLTQRLTTREPDREMLEVAVTALQAVLPDDPDADLWR
ncbi:MAG: DUF1385 domain-containing protein [Clostridiaceae bacterium]|mgnify:CR=1 FL=1|nr:DUF1385 domain-containing protein [Clostridiaceae bacterium]